MEDAPPAPGGGWRLVWAQSHYEQRGVRIKKNGVAQREAQSEAQGLRRGCAGVAHLAQGWRRGGAGVAHVAQGSQGVAQVWRRCGAGVAQVWRRCDQQPAANCN